VSPVAFSKRSQLWEGTDDMVPFPHSHEMTHPHDHTIGEHTLNYTGCPITVSHGNPQEERWKKSQPRGASGKTTASVCFGMTPTLASLLLSHFTKPYRCSF